MCGSHVQGSHVMMAIVSGIRDNDSDFVDLVVVV